MKATPTIPRPTTTTLVFLPGCLMVASESFLSAPLGSWLTAMDGDEVAQDMLLNFFSSFYSRPKSSRQRLRRSTAHTFTPIHKSGPVRCPRPLSGCESWRSTRIAFVECEQRYKWRSNTLGGMREQRTDVDSIDKTGDSTPPTSKVIHDPTNLNHANTKNRDDNCLALHTANYFLGPPPRGIAQYRSSSIWPP